MKKMLIAILLLSCLCAACTQEQVENPMDSATEAVATSEEISPKRIVPLPCTVDVNQLRDGTLAVSLKEDALRRDESGTLKMHLTVHTYDLYDLVDISRMQVGDTICINRQDLLITSLEETQYGSVLINGGLEKGGHELRTDENGVYYESGFSDIKSYYEIGSVTLPLSEKFVYVDASDLDQGERLWSLEEFEAMYEAVAFYFQPSSTSVVVADGVIASLTRVYVP